MGQRFGIIPASVRVETARSNVIDQLQKLRDAENHCTILKFTISSSNGNESMLLSIEGQTLPKWINKTILPDEFLQLRILITMKNCPLGFKFDDKHNICMCHHYLEYSAISLIIKRTEMPNSGSVY